MILNEYLNSPQQNETGVHIVDPCLLSKMDLSGMHLPEYFSNCGRDYGHPANFADTF